MTNPEAEYWWRRRLPLKKGLPIFLGYIFLIFEITTDSKELIGYFFIVWGSFIVFWVANALLIITQLIIKHILNSDRNLFKVYDLVYKCHLVVLLLIFIIINLNRSF